MRTQSNKQAEPVAIVGVGCRFPGAPGPGEFWRLLAAGVEAVGPVPADHPSRSAHPEGPVPRGGLLEELDHFDARFFGISPREAERLDPQQRLLLEVSWEALEDAGLAAPRLHGSATSVFVGMWLSDYEARMFSDSGPVDFHMTTGSGRYTASGRVSHFFGFRGPSVTVDTACSSSLVAVHLACQSLWIGEADLALAAGVNVILQPHITTAYARSGMLARDGRCKFGDQSADGYVRSEGIGVVVLKPLSHARRDRDPIRAVILGSAVNNDGHTGDSLGTPGQGGQEDLLRAAYRRAGVAPNAVHYVEAHGTGTRAGDPVELRALGAVLGRDRAPGDPCLVGSVKTNIGHTEGAAGIAGLIKVTLGLEHRLIPASLHCETPTTEVDWSGLGVAVSRSARAWPATGRPVAGVSSFGIAGTNAHVVLTVAPDEPADASAAPPAREHVLPLSARSPEALRALAERYAAHLSQPELPSAADLCFTAAVRRAHHEHRLAVVGRDARELGYRLRTLLRSGFAPPASFSPPARRPPRIAFVFPGQGSQWAGMGLGLAAVEPAFRDALQACDRAIASHTGWSLLEELRAGTRSRLDRIDVVQPALFATQVALAAQWRAWGVEPSAVVGHSMGEVAAAHVAGAIDLDTAARIICTRSALLRRISGQGAMAVVELPSDELDRRLGAAPLSIAVRNSERSTVVAGEVKALDELLAGLEADGIFCRRVKVDVASHSPQVDPLREDLLRGLAGIGPGRIRVPMYSTVTGAPVDGRDLGREYWMRNLRDTVQFGAAIARMRDDGCDTFLELSPHPVLLPAIEEGLGPARAGQCLSSLRREEPERAALLESLCALYRGGQEIDWPRLFSGHERCVALPTYAWQRERFWYPESTARAAGPAAPGAHPILEEHLVSSSEPGVHFWQGRLDTARLPWLLEHRVQGVAVLPAAAIVEMFLSAAGRLFGTATVVLENLRLTTPLAIRPEEPRIVQLVAATAGPDAATVRLASRASSGGWTVHATGLVRSAENTQPSPSAPLEDASEDGSGPEHYRAMRRRGLEYGPAFQGVAAIARRDGLIVTRLRPTEAMQDAGAWLAHPCLLDAAFQGMIAGIDTTGAAPTTTYVPAGVDRVIVHGPVAGRGDLACRVALRAPAGTQELAADVALIEATGRPVLEATGVRLARLDRGAAADVARCLFEVQWERQDPPGDTRSGDAGRWIVLGDRRGVGAALAERLAARGARVVLPARVDQVASRLHDAAGPVDGIVYLGGLDTEPPALGATATITEATPVQELAVLVKHLAAAVSTERPRLVLVTAGGQAVAVTDPVAPEQGPLWGAGAVAASEHPELRVRRVDVSAEPGSAEIEGLAHVCTEPDGESQIALRGHDRFVARLVRARPAPDLGEPAPVPAGTTPFRARASRVGTIDGLHLRPFARRRPGPGEVEIEVRAVGLNFMDVMSALASLPGHPDGVGPLGIECAGRVVAVGPNVNGPEPGDEVVAIAFDCLGSHAIADARLTVRRPAHLEPEAAASLPIAFLTASYALEHLGRLREDDRVLIHAATGGVGLAAVQLARRAGATVFATAGSPAKRDYLRALGVEHVLDSRSLAFAAEVKALTGGRGVDVVLNSLAGEAIAAGLSALAPYGRFVEIGKRDIYQNAALHLGPFRSNLSYAALDLERMCRERPDTVGHLLTRLITRVEAGEIQPLPVRVFPVGEVGAAFRFMAEARHIGRIALSLSPEHRQSAPLAAEPSAVRPDGTYLITGGLGAIGLALAGALVDAGARHLALLGRGAAGPEARRTIAELEQRGALVVTAQVDVAAPDAMAEVLAALRRDGPPLRGVIHAAGVLDDATLLKLEPAQIRAAMAPKATGAWVLHTLTAPDPLDFFVVCSSASAVLGLAGQANYAAANAFLDALARHRRHMSRPALSIAWGPWSDIGLAAAHRNRGSRLAQLGLESLAPQQGMRTLGLALAAGRPHLAVMDFDADTWSATQGGKPDPFLDALRSADGPRPLEPDAPLPVRLRAAPAAARLGLLQDHLIARVGDILRLQPTQVDPEAPLKSLGLDSLMTLELRNRLEADFGLRLSATLAWNYPTIAALVGYIGEALDLLTDPRLSADSIGPSTGAEHVAPDQVGTRLAEELARVKRLLEGPGGPARE